MPINSIELYTRQSVGRWFCCISLFGIGLNAFAADCESALWPLKELRKFHVEVAINNETDRQRELPFGKVSRRGSSESFALYENNPGVQGHAVSFGSGPDIHRLLQDFPLVPHLHLVDILMGQSSPGRVIRELEHRLKSIVGSGTVTQVSLGFAREVPWTVLDDHKAAYEYFVDHYPQMQDAPIVWRLQWQSPSLGHMDRMISLHLIDFDEPAKLERFLNDLETSGGLTGVLVTGTSIQNRTSLNMIFDHLRPNSTFAYEFFYCLSGKLQKIDPSDNSYEMCLAHGRADLTHQILGIHPNQEGTFGNYSRMHLFQKK